MDTLALTGEIMTRLQTFLPFVVVDNFPDKPESYILTHPKGALLVLYSGSDGDEGRRVRQFEVVAVSRGLNDACRLIEAARWILERWEPELGAGRFSCVDDSFMQVVTGTWWYGSRFEITGPSGHVKEQNLTDRINELFNITIEEPTP